jgi:lysophospholipid hydrolase
LQIDFALEWVQTAGGHILCRQNSHSDSIFIVINGRLRATYSKQQRRTSTSEVEYLEEFGQGDSVGELEVLTDTPRPYTLHAIRDTELIKLPNTLFNALALKDPRVTIRISRIIAEKSSQRHKLTPFGKVNLNRSSSDLDMSSAAKGAGPHAAPYSAQNAPISNMNLRSVAILPMNALVPVTEFAYNLRDSLESHVHASTTLLNQDRVFSVLGKHAFSKMGKLKLSNWLWEQEESSRIVLYLADGSVGSPWTQRCIKQVICFTFYLY